MKIWPGKYHVGASRHLLVALAFLGLCYVGPSLSLSYAAAQPSEAKADLILDSAESLFQAMKAVEPVTIWARLTERSRKTISEEVYKNVQSPASGGYTREVVYRDFEQGGPLSKEYWKAFLTNFDPDMVLEQSRWEMGPVRGDKAEISILFKKSERPAILKMVNEGGHWRVGLVETFWGRK